METTKIEEQLANIKLDFNKKTVFRKTKNNKEIIHLLNKLGKLPYNFDENILLYFVKHEHSTVRCLASLKK